METIELEELRRRLNDPSLAIVDVLPREMFEAGHIPGALSLPLDQVASRASAVLPDFEHEIAVYCAKPT